MTLMLLIYFIVVIHGTGVKNVLDNIGKYADVAADIVNLVTECEFSCPCGRFYLAWRYHFRFRPGTATVSVIQNLFIYACKMGQKSKPWCVLCDRHFVHFIGEV